MACVFVSSPLGFSEAGRRWNEDVVLPALEVAGWDVYDPWQASFVDGPLRSAAGAARAAERNRVALESADAVLAILDGTDVDSGTAAEIGYAVALGKRVVGLRTDPRGSGEYPGGTVNLQIEHFIDRSGGAIFAGLDAALDALAADR